MFIGDSSNLLDAAATGAMEVNKINKHKDMGQLY